MRLYSPRVLRHEEVMFQTTPQACGVKPCHGKPIQTDRQTDIAATRSHSLCVSALGAQFHTHVILALRTGLRRCWTVMRNKRVGITIMPRNDQIDSLNS
jgi:hypothetical protein